MSSFVFIEHLMDSCFQFCVQRTWMDVPKTERLHILTLTYHVWCGKHTNAFVHSLSDGLFFDPENICMTEPLCRESLIIWPLEHVNDWTFMQRTSH